MAFDIPPAYRVPLLVLGFASLITGVAAGLWRVGFGVPLPGEGFAQLHGPLMVSGFFGTVISLERAVAIGRAWAYGAPLAAGLAGLAAILGAPALLPAILAVVASLDLTAASVSIYRRQRELFTLILALGAGSWLAGNGLWLAGLPLSAIVPWWAGFLVLTIAGERLELSRFLPPSPVARGVFTVIIAALVAAMFASGFAAAGGTMLLGAAQLALALWLLRQDIARRTVKERGLTRFIAVCLLSGYLWLALSGAAMLAAGGLGSAGPWYDASVHALMLGFVFSMIFGHAAIIFPAVLRVAVPYHPVFYLPLAILHASLALRLWGDGAADAAWRAAGAMSNAVALALFILVMIGSVIRGALTCRR